MAIVRLFDKLGDFTDWSLFFQPKNPHYVSVHNATNFTYWPYSDVRVVMTGTGFAYGAGGVPVAGKIATVKVIWHGSALVKMTAVNESLPAFYHHAFGATANGAAALAVLFNGADTFIGSNRSDVVPLGPSNGNDIVRAGNGNDEVNGDKGNDVLNGGPGYDVLHYQPTYRPTLKPVGAFRGIDLDVATGKVIDPWGHRDTISNFESYQGSWFADVMKGSSGSDEFTGLRGADVIDGRGGIDRLWYNSEAYYGGKQGIAVHLESGTIKDGFGFIDSVSNIEVVIGTASSDTFFGNGDDNVFSGLAGVDSFDGGAGDHDQVSFFFNWHVGGNAGVIVNLGAGQILDDGFGNSETLVSIEDVQGSTLSDSITGDDNPNNLLGEAGNDFLDGRGGDDTIDGGDGDDTLVGGEGDDTVSYASAPASVRVSLGVDTAQNTLGAGTDTLSGFENLIGSVFADILTGDGNANRIDGGAGDDTINVPNLGFASIDGGNGNDTLALIGPKVLLDLSDPAMAARVHGIEKISLGGVDHKVVIDKDFLINNVAANSSGVHVLTVDGTMWANVSFVETEWSTAGTILSAGVTYNRYVLGNAEVRVQQGVRASAFDMTTVSAEKGFVIQGDAAEDLAGSVVSSAGDINGDGFDDLIISAPHGDDGGNNAGEAYVVLGTAAGFGSDISGRQVIDLTTLSPATGFIVQGAAADAEAGRSVARAGDVNGDGFDDLIVTSTTSANGAFVLFGTDSLFGSEVAGRQVFDLANLSAGTGFVVESAGSGVQTGASAGDVNGDGFTDMIFGSPSKNFESGEACIVFGTASGFGTDVGGKQVLELTTLSAAEGFVIVGDSQFDHTGVHISEAGDVNGDGLGDLIVAAPGFGGGDVYVVFGNKSGFGTSIGGRQVIDVSTLSGTTGFVIQGDDPGADVATAGDINGDGYDDLIVGASTGAPDYQGAAYVLFGTSAGFGVPVNGRQIVDLTALTASEGFKISSVSYGVSVGGSVAPAGDVNGDGFDDLILGTDQANEAFLLFGTDSGFGTSVGGHQFLSLSTLATSQGIVIEGDTLGDFAGSSVASAGDVNNDGFDDLVIGAPRGSDGGYLAGEAYVIFGQAFGGLTAPVVTTGTAAAENLIGGLGNDTLAGGGGVDSIRGGAGNDTISVPDVAFRSINGGSGLDTLVFTGTSQAIDFTTLADTRIKGIEALDISGTGDDTIGIGALDAFHFSDTPNADFTGAGSHKNLVVTGDAGDAVSLHGYDPDGAGPVEGYVWQLAGSGKHLDGSSGGGFNFYDLVRGSAIVASAAIDSDVGVVIA